MQKIKVVKKEVKNIPKGGTLVALYDAKGARYSGFHASLQEINEGDTINAEIEVDGKYNNIVSFEFVERASGAATPPSRGEDNRERESIEAQVAAKVVGQLIQVQVIKGDEPLGQALMDWCYLKLTGRKLELKKQEVMPVVKTEAKPKPAPKPTHDASCPVTMEPPTDELLGFVNRQWFLDTLKELQGKGLKLWADAKVLELLNIWLGKAEGEMCKTLEDALKQLPRDKAEKLVNKMREQKELA